MDNSSSDRSPLAGDEQPGSVHVAGHFPDQLRSTLDASTAGLDGHTLAKLHAARNAAIAARRRPGIGALATKWTLGVSTALTAAVLVFALLPHGALPVDGQPRDEPAVLPGDLDLLSEVDDPDDFDDLAFYEWLAANEHSG